MRNTVSMEFKEICRGPINEKSYSDVEECLYWNELTDACKTEWVSDQHMEQGILQDMWKDHCPACA